MRYSLERPEEKARKNIDSMLVASGWSVQNLDDYDFGVSIGVAIREFSIGRDAADYLLFLDGKAVGVVESKPEGTTRRCFGSDLEVHDRIT